MKEVNNRLTKQIDEVHAEVVVEAIGTAKEIVVAASNKEVTSFATTHLKDYASKFFKSLLDNEDVASHLEIKAIHKSLSKTEEAHKALISKITQSASATNNVDAAIKGDIY